MFKHRLDAGHLQRHSLLCVGLDPEPDVLKQLGETYLSYTQAVVDATHPYALCYKPQLAHYSAYGQEDALVRAIRYIHTTYPSHPVILDAKRGDVGHTAVHYAREAFKRYCADAVTLNPYLGMDSLRPFLAYNRGVVLLARTSNPSAELQEVLVEGVPLYLHLSTTLWNAIEAKDNVLFVVGATAPTALSTMAHTFPDTWLLVPGVGAQGGRIADLMKAVETRSQPRALLSVSRGLLPPTLNPLTWRHYVREKAAYYAGETNNLSPPL